MSLLRLFLVFMHIGSLSWGGGAATLAMLHHEFCVRRPIVSEEEFQVLFSLSRMTPGMNLLSLTVLLGHKLHRVPGAIMALLGLTAPSFAIIIVGCLLLKGNNPHPYIARMMHGLQPAIVALLVHTAWQMNTKSMSSQQKAQRMMWPILVIGTVALTLASTVHPAWLVLGGGLCGVLLSQKMGSSDRGDASPEEQAASNEGGPRL